MHVMAQAKVGGTPFMLPPHIYSKRLGPQRGVEATERVRDTQESRL